MARPLTHKGLLRRLEKLGLSVEQTEKDGDTTYKLKYITKAPDCKCWTCTEFPDHPVRSGLRLIFSQGETLDWDIVLSTIQETFNRRLERHGIDIRELPWNKYKQ